MVILDIEITEVVATVYLDEQLTRILLTDEQFDKLVQEVNDARDERDRTQGSS